jgi:hypothetical protein
LLANQQQQQACFTAAQQQQQACGHTLQGEQRQSGSVAYELLQPYERVLQQQQQQQDSGLLSGLWLQPGLGAAEQQQQQSVPAGSRGDGGAVQYGADAALQQFQQLASGPTAGQVLSSATDQGLEPMRQLHHHGMHTASAATTSGTTSTHAAVIASVDHSYA